MLTLIYRWALRFRRQDEVTADMLQTFEEARDEARTQGMRAYLAFACREILGLMGARGGKTQRWPRILAWSLAGLAAGVLATYVFPARYTSDAALLIAPPLISDHPASADANFDWDGTLSTILPVIRSRTVLVTIINTFGLYRSMRARQPIEDVVNRMRRDIHIERAGRNGIAVSFTYGDRNKCYNLGAGDLILEYTCDRFMAQRVTQALVSRLIDEWIKSSRNQAVVTSTYFEQLSVEAAKHWEKLNAELQQTSRNDPQLERLLLDRDLARKEYESIREKANEAQRMDMLEKQKLGRTIEMLDPASLPQLPDTPGYLIYGIGLGCGFLLGVILALIRTIRGTTTLILPQTSEG